MVESLQALIVTLQSLVASMESTIEQLRADLAQRDAELAKLRQARFGQKRERVVSVEREIVRHQPSEQDKARRREAAAKKRRDNRQKRAELDTVEIRHDLDPEGGLHCPRCEQGTLGALGSSEESEEFEHIPARLVRRRHLRTKYICSCCSTIVTAPGPTKVSDGCQYGPGLHAHVAVSKCADALPLDRQARRLRRHGLPVSRSTLTDMFHRAAELLRPLYARLVELMPAQPRINADETPIKVQAKGKTRTAYLWTFIAGGLLVYIFSKSRAGATPSEVLGGSVGTLQVDGYTGYNAVCSVDGRDRIACLAHIRRNFFEARSTEALVADEAIERIRQLYAIEHEAAEANILGTAEHLNMRQLRSQPLFDDLVAWVAEQKALHRPKSPIGQALRYADGQLGYLRLVLDDPLLTWDNNVSERALRWVALGRKNFLFVGHDTAGENLAVLQTLVATCLANDVPPEEYITDVLIRTQHTPASEIDSLLPQNWKQLRAS
jgi:transposase